jgi:UDP-glucose 4-epimerase
VVTVVTGGTGFVASNIVKNLTERGHQVVSLDTKPPDDLLMRYLAPTNAKVTWVQGDILDERILQKVAANYSVDKIVHAAVYTGQRPDIERDASRRIIEINVAGTANMLELARQARVQRFLYVSSGAVYEGKRSNGKTIQEDVSVKPHSLYNVTKYASELLTQRCGELHGFETVSLRLSSAYGPMERPTDVRVSMSLMHEWTGKALRGEPIELTPRSVGGDFTYVLDIAEGICTVLDAATLSHQAYNLARGQWLSRDGLIAAFREAYPEAQFIEKNILSSPDTIATEFRQSVMDTTRLREDLGFRAQTSLVSGLRAYLKWRQDYSYTK